MAPASPASAASRSASMVSARAGLSRRRLGRGQEGGDEMRLAFYFYPCRADHADWPRFLQIYYKSAYTARRFRTGPERQILTRLRLRQRKCAVLGRHRRLMEASNDPLVCHISGCPPKKKEMTSTKMMMMIPIHGAWCMVLIVHRPQQKPSDTGDSRAIPQPSTNPAQSCLSSMF